MFSGTRSGGILVGTPTLMVSGTAPLPLRLRIAGVFGLGGALQGERDPFGLLATGPQYRAHRRA
jgi:hypothetical protein